MKKSLYIHIPFCRTKCPYCDFYSIVYKPNCASSYIDTICRQIEQLDSQFSTIYIGGGTPTVLDIRLLEKLLGSLEKISADAEEVTIEANPESLDEAKMRLFGCGGVNRISIGVQSLRNEKLRKLGRIHSVQNALDAIDMARSQEFDNISIDLIFGVRGETFNSWRKELYEATRLPIAHLSLYSLTYERDALAFGKGEKVCIKPLNEEAVAKLYSFAIEYLPGEQFTQYEISSFSKRGYRCRHNLHYWENNSYVGLGPSAVSYLDGTRMRNIPDVNEYVRKVGAGEAPVVFKEKLSDLQRARETAALKIRTREGIDFDAFKKKSGFDFAELTADCLPGLIEKGLVRWKDRDGSKVGVCLTGSGFLFCDSVSSEFLQEEA
ncbi:MAG: radical SAM family heme chaperone HemW [Candidatus Omnitrophota bacterium]|nr:MAG: radical SAM family heme chaperone HemW [Candidatus Omnitrophota bacterium]